MSIAGYNKNITSVAVIDPAGTLKVAIFKAPFGGATIHAAYISTSAAIAASGSNTVTGTLIDGGANGAGTTSMGSFAVDASTATLANNMFQSTPPVWGATCRLAPRCLIPRVSIHAPRVEGWTYHFIRPVF